jgi:hypothetical protein
MNDAAARCHPVDGTWFDTLDIAHAVTVNQGAFEQVGYGRKTNVRMRPDVEVVLRPYLERAKMVEKYKWPDASQSERREQTPHHHAATEVVQPGLQYFDYGHIPNFTMISPAPVITSITRW